MKLVRSTLSDVPIIMSFIHDAQVYLASLKIDQWQDGYPNKEKIELDISNNDSYVVMDDNETIIGTTVFTTKTEHAYKAIQGNWITNDNVEYGVIHRLAVGDKYRNLGLARFVFKECHERLKESNIGSLRIDTHEGNKGMQYLLKDLGYIYCGIIILESGDERLAFEKIL
mgnify:FL=1